MKPDLKWMSRPFAHRGLHDVSNGIVENTASSVQAALDQDVGIEVDLRLASCGSVMVFHDGQLDRLTLGQGTLELMDKAELQQIAFRDTSDTMLSLSELLEQVDGRVPLLLEIKSNWSDDRYTVQNFVLRIIETLKDYKGPFGVMSFDPAYMTAFHKLAPELPRGLVAEQFQKRAHWPQLSLLNRLSLRFLLSFTRTKPDFIAYDIDALPAIAPLVARKFFKRPLLTWTVRTPAQQQTASKYCDAMIFETFLPENKQPISGP